MEHTKHIELGRLLRAAAKGKIALFAMELSEGEADILASCEQNVDC